MLYPTPKKVALELVAPNDFTARLQRAGDRGRSHLQRRPDGLPPYNAYGADGDVTGRTRLREPGHARRLQGTRAPGIDVKGKIVIARYGGGWRGLKPKLAHEHGAIGCIIYSDPQEDGYATGDTYPKGGFRPADGVQRGSVMDMPVYPGDPLTPGVGATRMRSA